jgi:hypothetical protein
MIPKQETQWAKLLQITSNFIALVTHYCAAQRPYMASLQKMIEDTVTNEKQSEFIIMSWTHWQNGMQWSFFLTL